MEDDEKNRLQQGEGISNVIDLEANTLEGQGSEGITTKIMFEIIATTVTTTSSGLNLNVNAGDNTKALFFLA